jgi:hypothetical protein
VEPPRIVAISLAPGESGLPTSFDRRPRTPIAPASAPQPRGYVVRDANGQALAYLYSRDNDAEARQARVLTADEARRIIARLPGLLKGGAQQG